MKLLIRQRVFSWSDTYDVYDEAGTPKYYVKAEVFTLGHRIHVYAHATGEEVGQVNQRLMTLLPKFEVSIRGRSLGCVAKQWSLFRPRYELDYHNWQVEGDFLGWDYRVMSPAGTVMTISKEPFHWGDTYVLEYGDPAQEVAGLLLVIAIDAANCDG